MQCRQIVDRPDVNRPGRADHQKRHKTRGAIGSNLRTQRIDINAMTATGRNSPQRVGAEAGEVHGFRDAAVRRH